MKLVLATENTGKIVELRQLLGDLVMLQSLADYPDVVMPPETGVTFAENARAKAEFISATLGLPALADDSGLEVDALNGGPGVHSKRYAEGTDADRNTKLLGALANTSRRTARYVAALAFAAPGRSTVIEQATCEGEIAHAPQGEGGFGYDPIFRVDTRTMAELAPAEKNALSHRGRALKKILPHLRHYFS